MRCFWSQQGRIIWSDWLLVAFIVTAFGAAVRLSGQGSFPKQTTPSRPSIFDISRDTTVPADLLIDDEDDRTHYDSPAVLISSFEPPNKYGRVKVNFVLANFTDRDFDFYGYVSHYFNPPLETGTVEPMICVQRQIDGEWKAVSSFGGSECIWGPPAMIRLPPGRAGKFGFCIEITKEATRVGFRFRHHREGQSQLLTEVELSDLLMFWSPPFHVVE